MATTITKRDGVALDIHADNFEASHRMHQRVGYSIDHATRHEGYELSAPEPWDAKKAHDLRWTARSLFARHDHAGYMDALTRENCGACVLGGYGADEAGPNYAGWERATVQAGRTIAFQHVLTALNCENRAYADAFARDLATFPLNISRESNA